MSTIPITLTKKELCRIFDSESFTYFFPSGRPNTEKLAKYIFTDKVLAQIGMTREQYKSAYTFTALQTNKIIAVLKLTKEEIFSNI